MLENDRYVVPMDHKFNGMYRGEVVSVNDPLAAKRIQVRVQGVYDEISDEFLPWAQYADPFFLTSQNSGSAFIPDPGDRVWVFFEAGDHMQPVYFAGATAANDGVIGAGSATDNRIFRTKAGHQLEMDDTSGNNRVKLRHSTDSFMQFDNNGYGWTKAPKIDLGELSHLEPSVLGNKLAAWGEALISWLDGHDHGGSPPSSPFRPSGSDILSGGNVYSRRNRNQ